MDSEFPETLYVCYENEGTDDEYINATDDPGMLADIDTDRKAARYKLDRIVAVVNRTTVTGGLARRRCCK